MNTNNDIVEGSEEVWQMEDARFFIKKGLDIIEYDAEKLDAILRSILEEVMTEPEGEAQV